MKDLVYHSAAEKKLVEAVICQESVNTLTEIVQLAEACCDECGCTFVGEVGEA